MRIAKKLEKNAPRRRMRRYIIYGIPAHRHYTIRTIRSSDCPKIKKTLTPRQTNTCAYLVSSSVFKKYIAPRRIRHTLPIISAVRTIIMHLLKKLVHTYYINITHQEIIVIIIII